MDRLSLYYGTDDESSLIDKCLEDIEINGDHAVAQKMFQLVFDNSGLVNSPQVASSARSSSVIEKSTVFLEHEGRLSLFDMEEKNFCSNTMFSKLEELNWSSPIHLDILLKPMVDAEEPLPLVRVHVHCLRVAHWQCINKYRAKNDFSLEKESLLLVEINMAKLLVSRLSVSKSGSAQMMAWLEFMAELMGTCEGEHLIFKMPSILEEYVNVVHEIVEMVPQLAKLLNVDLEKLPTLDNTSARILACLSMKHPSTEGLKAASFVLKWILSTKLINSESDILALKTALICLRAYPRELMEAVMPVILKLSQSISEEVIRLAIEDIGEIQKDLGRPLYHRKVSPLVGMTTE